MRANEEEYMGDNKAPSDPVQSEEAEEDTSCVPKWCTAGRRTWTQGVLKQTPEGSKRPRKTMAVGGGPEEDDERWESCRHKRAKNQRRQ